MHVIFFHDEMINQKTTYEYLISFLILFKISKIIRNVVMTLNTFVFCIEIKKKIHFFIVLFVKNLNIKDA